MGIFQVPWSLFPSHYWWRILVVSPFYSPVTNLPGSAPFVCPHPLRWPSHRHIRPPWPRGPVPLSANENDLRAGAIFRKAGRSDGVVEENIWELLMGIFDGNFWWEFLMGIFDGNIPAKRIIPRLQWIDLRENREPETMVFTTKIQGKTWNLGQNMPNPRRFGPFHLYKIVILGYPPFSKNPLWIWWLSWKNDEMVGMVGEPLVHQTLEIRSPSRWVIWNNWNKRLGWKKSKFLFELSWVIHWLASKK